MTPETRAAEIVSLFWEIANDAARWPNATEATIGASRELPTLIASAIREAENAALERAEQDIRLTALAAFGQWETGSDCFQYAEGLSAASDRIKSMKGEVCGCGSCSETVTHASDCAVHNAPALPAGPCDCDANSKSMKGE